jgi:hypothetical protein
MEFIISLSCPQALVSVLGHWDPAHIIANSSFESDYSVFPFIDGVPK